LLIPACYWRLQEWPIMFCISTIISLASSGLPKKRRPALMHRVRELQTIDTARHLGIGEK
jgi:hypothetical protein